MLRYLRMTDATTVAAGTTTTARAVFQKVTAALTANHAGVNLSVVELAEAAPGMQPRAAGRQEGVILHQGTEGPAGAK